ncbi:MAG: TonB-dependent receptor domain-containing protein [Gammaproteobacteria bacterium]
MKNFNYSNLFFTFLLMFAFNVVADNPGDDTEASSTESSESQAVESTEEEVVTEEEVETTSSDADGEVVTLEKVVVTGSRIKRTQEEGALPLLVITKEDIDNAGFRNVTEALQSIPSANEYTQNESLTNNFTPNANELDLRNLGPGRVLFLINGRRTADYPIPYNNAGNIVNTGVVPIGLVDRIEVLSQGASAIYGSDAVSGVVNIITRKGIDYNSVNVYASETDNGGDNIYQATFITGGFKGSSSWTAGIDLTSVDPMYYADREMFDSFTDDPAYGTDYVSPRWGFLWYTGSDGLGPRAFYGLEEFGIPCNSLDPAYFNFVKQDPEWNYSGSYPGAGCGMDYGSERFGGNSPSMVNEREDYTAYVSFNHTFNNGINFESRLYQYNDEAYYRSSVNRNIFLGGILDPIRINALTSTSSIPETALGTTLTVPYFNRVFSAQGAPAAENRADIEETLTDAFIGFNGITQRGFEWSIGVNTSEYEYATSDMTFTDAIYDYFTGVGATDENGNLLTGTYFNDAYNGQGRLDYLNSIDYFADLGRVATVNDALTAYGLPTDPACGYENQFGRSSCFLIDRLAGAVSQDMLMSWLADDSQLGESEQTTFDFQLTGEFELMDRFVGFAFTMEHQKQKYDLTPSAGRLDDNAGDEIRFIQGSAIDGGGSRTRKSAGVEFAFPVNNKLELSVASRYDGYDDASSNVGSRRSNMFNFAYRPNEDLLIRGSASETFRAPDMNYLFQEASSGFYNGIQDYVACYAYSISGLTDDETGELLYDYDDYRDCEIGSGSVRAFLEGNTELREEEGENFQLGVVWQINNNMSLRVDLYEVLLERAVTREDPYSINFAEGKCVYGSAFEDFMRDEFPDRDCDALLAKVVRGPASDSLTGDPLPIGSWDEVYPAYANQSYLNYEGADWEFNYRKETENIGDFYFSILSSHILKSAEKFDEYSDELDNLDAYLYQPRSQQNISLGWLYQEWSVNVFTDRTGHMEAYSQLNKTEPHMTTNISVNYNYNTDLRLYFSIRNVEDKMPQVDPAYGYPYYNRGYFSAFGRYATVGVSYIF